MRFKDKLNLPVGYIRLYLRNKKTRKITRRIDVKNVVTYEGASILPHALAGDYNYRVTHIYGEHVTPGGGYLEGQLNGMEALKTDTIDDLRTPPRSTEHAESPVIFANYYTSSAPYNNNIVTFTASWSSNDLAGELIQGAGLVTQFKNAERLFAHAYFPAVAMQAGEELICHWSEIFI